MENAQVTLIRATSRASRKIRDNSGSDSYYTIEFCEERSLREGLSDAEIAEERAKLWDTVNAECDNQIAEIIKTFANTN